MKVSKKTTYVQLQRAIIRTAYEAFCTVNRRKIVNPEKAFIAGWRARERYDDRRLNDYPQESDWPLRTKEQS
jgi:hypothetical protein